MLNSQMAEAHKSVDRNAVEANASIDLSEIEKSSFDDLLVAVGQSQNRDAFIRLFEHFAPRVKSFLMKGKVTSELADELAQETMLIVWNKAKSYNPEKAAASTWIFTIARNKKIDYLRKKSAIDPNYEINDPIVADETITPADVTTNRHQQSQIIKDAMKNLPEEQAFLIKKAFYEDKTHSEIAEETDIPLGTIKSRLRLAMGRLHHHLSDLKD